MSGGEVVYSGWLRKSPPEKKLRRYAWKKRWFVLRSGRMTGDPDILEYYKNDHAKKPIRVIDLNLCEQVDAGLTFNKKDLEHSFIFDIKTIDRIFYLVADTEEEMNKWVRCICDICGFNPTDTEDSAKISHQVNVPGGLVVDMAPSGGPGGALGASALANLPPPYQPVSIRPLGSSSKPIQEPNYVPMTPGTVEFSSLGKQVPPPAHMGFRSSPKTPPRRPVHIPECQPPPVDRNLKPDRKAKPAPLEIKPLAEWEEYTAPVRSPVTRSFTRDPSRCTAAPRPSSGHSTASSSDSDDCDENYVAMQHANMSTDEPNMKLSAPMNADGGGSPMVKPKGDKQVEYLDLDLDPGKSTPPRKKKSNGTGISASDERVDYVVVDQHRTQALKSTREAWSDERQSTEQDPPNKGAK
uniref:GRB2-associated binding protein 1 n=1 Tax=Cyprinus carpio carpio TaxID=630221 RepID=A0A9J8CNU4_CYPCA